MKEFKDKVLVVTGGSRGIGKAIAVEGAKRGMKIVLNDIDGDQLAKTCAEIKDMGVECISQHADISLYENIEALLKLAMDNYGHVDMLVNNAGCAVSGAIWKLPKQDIDWITELNFLSHLYGMKVFLPQMIAQNTPCEIINVESTAGLMTSGKATMYHATKAAGVAASESVYIAMKEQGYPINIHCLVPAYVKTTIHLADLHRPERFAMNDDPYYTSDEYKAGQIRGERGVMSGIHDDEPYYHTEQYAGMVAFNKMLLDSGAPLDIAVETIFTALEKEQFYILDSAKYERLLCEQGVFEAEKVRPVDFYTLN